MTVYIVMYERRLNEINVDSVWSNKVDAERAVKKMHGADPDYHFWIIEHPVIGT